MNSVTSPFGFCSGPSIKRNAGLKSRSNPKDNSRSPSDFAQSGLFGDDNKKDKGNSNAGPSTALFAKFASSFAQDDN
jgi:hypothetical protein